jgi:hypothetical protein
VGSGVSVLESERCADVCCVLCVAPGDCSVDSESLDVIGYSVMLMGELISVDFVEI